MNVCSCHLKWVVPDLRDMDVARLAVQEQPSPSKPVIPELQIVV